MCKMNLEYIIIIILFQKKKKFFSSKNVLYNSIVLSVKCTRLISLKVGRKVINGILRIRISNFENIAVLPAKNICWLYLGALKNMHLHLSNSFFH